MVVVEARYASNNDGDDDCGAVVAMMVIVVTIVYGKPKKLLAKSRTMSLSLRRFVALPKIVQTDYQPRSPQDKTA